MSAENLSLWASVCKTAPSHTKKVNQRGGYTAIDPTWQAQKATEVFGIYGIGWGLRNAELDYSLHEATGMAVLRATFFYVFEGKEGAFPVHNAIKTSQGSGASAKPDEDFAKKLETNTISKALSRLGFSADVFLGLFDDVGYVETAKTKEAIQKADDQEASLAEEQKKFLDWCTQEIKSYAMIPNAAALKGVHQGHLNKIQRQCSVLQMDASKYSGRFAQEFEQRLAELREKKAATQAG